MSRPHDALPVAAQPSAPTTAALTRFQRVLVGTDGTVTHILEVYAGEPVEVVKLLQGFDQSTAADAQLLPPGGEVLRRRVLLRGRSSGQNLLYAEAVVALDRVDATIVEGLLETEKPMGVLLAESRLETFREILLVGVEEAAAIAAVFDVAKTAEVVSRTYRILAGGRPIILVTEKFPSTFFRGLPG